MISSRARGHDWRLMLPVFELSQVTLREIQPCDTASLMRELGADEVSQFIALPASMDAFDRYIARAHLDRQLGRYACFAAVPAGRATAVGVFQVRLLETSAGTAEWGFAMGAGYWGTGLFGTCARQVLAFAFDTMGLHRLEARVAASNGRCHGALHKLGAVQEGVLRNACSHDGAAQDQLLWALLADDWRHQSKRQRGSVRANSLRLDDDGAAHATLVPCDWPISISSYPRT